MLRNSSGMVLAEVLISVVIMSVGIAVVMQSLGSNFRAVMAHQEYLRALGLVQDKLEEQLFTDTTQASQPDLAAPEPWERFHYHWEYKNISDDLWQGLKQLDLAVSWPDGKGERRLGVKTCLPDAGTQEKKTSVFFN